MIVKHGKLFVMNLDNIKLFERLLKKYMGIREDALKKNQETSKSPNKSGNKKVIF